MLNTWFNNVNIYFEASGSIRLMLNDIRHAAVNDPHWTGDIQQDFWKYVVTADRLLRNNTGHFFPRLTPGSWQGYYGFVAANHWMKTKANITNETASSVIYLGLGNVG